ncbi:hypothetical protein Pmar_PMAR000345, partial [Perkinsus marinus ATCC 50983]
VYTIEVLRDIYEDSDARNAIGDKCAKELVGEVRADSGEAVSEDPPDTAKQSDATVGKSSAVSSVGTSSGGGTSGYDQMTYQIIKARVVGALKRVTKSGGNDKTAGSEDTIQVMNSKALSMFGVIPSEAVTLLPQIAEKIDKDPLGYIQLRTYKEGETGKPKLVAGLNNESVWIKNLPKGLPIVSMEHWIPAICSWGVTVCIVVGENPVCVLEYVSRVSWLATQVGVSAALKYDNLYRMQLKVNVHRLQAMDKKKTLGKALAECLRVNQSNDLIIQAYGNGNLRVSNTTRSSMGGGGGRDHGSVNSDRTVWPGVCKYSKKDCPFPACKYSVHSDEVPVQRRVGKGSQGKGAGKGQPWYNSRLSGDGKRNFPVEGANTNNNKLARTSN